MLDKFAGGAVALFFAYIVAASTGNTSESIEALSASTISIIILLFYKFMLSYDSVEKPEKESAALSIMYHAALTIPLIAFLLILGSINPWLSKFAFVIFLICFAFLIAHFLHGYKEEKNVAERISTANESIKKIAKRADEKLFPCIIFVIGLLYGLGFAIDWNIQVGGLWDVSLKTQLETEKSAWDIVAAIGSLLAGLGTVGLLAFGWVKADSWIAQIKSNARISLIIEASNRLIAESNSLNEHLKNNVFPMFGESIGENTSALKVHGIEKVSKGCVKHTNQISIQLRTLNSSCKPTTKSVIYEQFSDLTSKLNLISVHLANLEKNNLSKREFQQMITDFVIDTQALQGSIIEKELH